MNPRMKPKNALAILAMLLIAASGAVADPPQFEVQKSKKSTAVFDEGYVAKHQHTERGGVVTDVYVTIVPLDDTGVATAAEPDVRVKSSLQGLTLREMFEQGCPLEGETLREFLADYDHPKEILEIRDLLISLGFQEIVDMATVVLYPVHVVYEYETWICEEYTLRTLLENDWLFPDEPALQDELIRTYGNPWEIIDAEDLLIPMGYEDVVEQAYQDTEGEEMPGGALDKEADDDDSEITVTVTVCVTVKASIPGVAEVEVEACVSVSGPLSRYAELKRLAKQLAREAGIEAVQEALEDLKEKLKDFFKGEVKDKADEVKDKAKEKIDEMKKKLKELWGMAEPYYYLIFII